jgi:UDP-N-acetylglucosamine transferase subunit ALG13
MKKILCCWELGDDYGHIGQFYPIIQHLLEQGYTVFFAVKDLSKIESFKWHKNITFLQAPVWLPQLRKPIVTQCYAEVILHKGYHAISALRPLVKAWVNLFDLLKPDLIIVDHSPTALLASSKRLIPRIILSNPYITPPAGSPPVNIRPWDSFDAERIVKSDAYVAKIINAVAQDLNLSKVNYVSDLFAADKIILSGYKKLDFYESSRKDALYKGGLIASESGLRKPVWPSASKLKIFAYLKYGQEQSDVILSILHEQEACVVCFYSGAKSEHYEKYRSSSFIFSDQPFDMQAVYQEASVIICHAGTGTVYSALYFGCPLIVIPNQPEQKNTANKLEQLHLGVSIDSADSVDEVREKVNRFFRNPAYFENAKIFASQVNTISSCNSINMISNECESLLKR